MSLAECIERWLNIQEFSNNAVSFESFTYVRLSNTIKRGLYTLTSKGKITGSSMGTLVHNRKKFNQIWLKSNPELADLPEDMLEELMRAEADYQVNEKTGEVKPGSFRLPANTIDETDLTAVIGGNNEQDSGEIFSNEISKGDDSNVDLETIEAESLEYYKGLIDSLKKIFGMFKPQLNPITNTYQNSSSKLFDKYEYYIFMYGYGFIRKKDPETKSLDRDYTQEEIANLIWKMKKDDGLNPTSAMSQSNVSHTLATITEKINALTRKDKDLRKGLLYLFDYWKNHYTELRRLSGQRELLNIKLDENKLNDYLQEHPQQKERIGDRVMSDFLIDDLDSAPLLPKELEKSIEDLFYLKTNVPKSTQQQRSSKQQILGLDSISQEELKRL
jgi:hypothetical protein